MNPDPGLGDILAALTPSAAVLLVTSLRDSPESSFVPEVVTKLPVSAAERARIADFIERSFERAADGAIRSLGGEPCPGSRFFASTGTYSAFHTCNTWTAEALAAGGLPIHAEGVLFSGGVISQAQDIAAARGQMSRGPD